MPKYYEYEYQAFTLKVSSSLCHKLCLSHCISVNFLFQALYELFDSEVGSRLTRLDLHYVTERPGLELITLDQVILQILRGRIFGMGSHFLRHFGLL